MRLFILLLGLFVLYGCGSDKSDEPREETVGKEIADGYNQQMQKARDVEKQLEEQRRKLDEAIEESDP